MANNLQAAAGMAEPPAFLREVIAEGNSLLERIQHETSIIRNVADRAFGPTSTKADPKGPMPPATGNVEEIRVLMACIGRAMEVLHDEIVRVRDI